MRPPPFLLGAALLFWGWRTDMLFFGALAGGLLELSNVVRGRWEFSDREFNRLWDVCTVLFLAAAVYLRFSEDVTSAAYKFFQWMPLIFYPMALGYLFSPREAVPLKAFSWFLRRKGAEGGDRGIAFGWIYLAVVLVTAGSTNLRDPGYYIGTALFTGWALWCVRPRRVPEWSWVVIFLAVASAGFIAQAHMQELQAYIENKASDLFVKFGRREFDPNRSRTAMGRIGSLKQSGRIVMKVKAEHGTMPERLRQSSYSRLDRVTWRGSGRSFENLPVEPDATTWTIIPHATNGSSVRITERVNRRNALLSVPQGTFQLRDLHANQVRTNLYAVLLASDNPGLLDYSAWHGPFSAEMPPEDRDLSIPSDERQAIRQIAEELKVARLPQERQVAAIPRYFENNFRYTTYQRAEDLGLNSGTPLSNFLLNTRAGHCEYFGSATVLLLRHLGIPARYVTGYSVQEYSRKEEAYIVRERHGHAWAVAWLNGRWVEVDSTPPDWNQEEMEEFPFHQQFKDWWEQFTFGFLEWRWLGDWGIFRTAAPWLIAPLTAFLVWRVFGRRMSVAHRSVRETGTWPGADSEFFKLDRRLTRVGLGRRNHETNSEWLTRIAPDVPLIADLLGSILRIHYRYRFDPDGIPKEDLTRLNALVRECLAKV